MKFFLTEFCNKKKALIKFVSINVQCVCFCVCVCVSVCVVVVVANLIRNSNIHDH